METTVTLGHPHRLIGVNAATANGVHHATGRRVGSLPIRIDDLIRQ